MRLHLATAAAGLLLFAGVGAAAAQDVIIQPEQETVIREYVQKKPLASIKIPGVELNVGTALPDTVELHEVPTVNTAMSSSTTRPCLSIPTHARS